MKHTYRDLIEKAYENFNARNADAIFSTMNPDVRWPRAWEGDFVTGFAAIRDYWTKQWREINPVVMPITFTPIADNVIEVGMQQTVKDLNGMVLFDGIVKHIYTFENGLIKSMEIKM